MYICPFISSFFIYMQIFHNIYITLLLMIYILEEITLKIENGHI